MYLLQGSDQGYARCINKDGKDESHGNPQSGIPSVLFGIRIALTEIKMRWTCF
jgi:hypothetical protein